MQGVLPLALLNVQVATPNKAQSSQLSLLRCLSALLLWIGSTLGCTVSNQPLFSSFSGFSLAADTAYTA